MMIRTVVLLSFVLLSCGCGARGVQIDRAQLADMEVGVTRYDEVVSALGEPSSRTVDSQGDIHLHYTYSFYAIKPETYIPVFGEHVGGMSNSSKSTVISFGADGVMKNSTLFKIKTDAGGAY